MLTRKVLAGSPWCYARITHNACRTGNLCYAVPVSRCTAATPMSHSMLAHCSGAAACPSAGQRGGVSRDDRELWDAAGRRLAAGAVPPGLHALRPSIAAMLTMYCMIRALLPAGSPNPASRPLHAMRHMQAHAHAGPCMDGCSSVPRPARPLSLSQPIPAPGACDRAPRTDAAGGAARSTTPRRQALCTTTSS